MGEALILHSLQVSKTIPAASALVLALVCYLVLVGFKYTLKKIFQLLTIEAMAGAR